MLASSLSADASEVAEDDPVAFNQQLGRWQVVGDPRLNTCFMQFNSEYNQTKMAVAAVASLDRFHFSISNQAWQSLRDGELRVNAVFKNEAGSTTDLWSLSALGIAASEGGPNIRWEINRSKNDGASFVEQMKSAAEVWLLNGEVPIAKFDLDGSHWAFTKLEECRATIRVHEDFDPFAR